MSLQTVLDIVAERGLTLYLDADGMPRMGGPQQQRSPALMDAVRAYRQEIIEHLRLKAARRVVLLAGGRDSEVERVLEVCPDVGHEQRVRHWADKHPGRTVAGECLCKDHTGEHWSRFLFAQGAAEANGGEPASSARDL
jgi:hypothetical protein